MRPITLLLVILLAAVCGAGFTAPAVAQTIEAAPASAAPGAMFFANLEELTAGSGYRIYLERGNPYVERFQLADFISADTDASRKLSVPSTAQQSAHHLVLYQGATERARTAFNITAPLQITLTPNSAEPGKKVRVAVSGTRTGSLTIGYAGGNVIGPVSVGTRGYSGSFIVPRDRPASLPATVVVDATNYTGRVVAARGKVNFAARAPSGLPPFRSQLVTPPPPSAREGLRIDFAGSLRQPDNSGTAGRTSFFWKGDDGQVVPIDGGVDTAADGSYQVRARAPSYYMDGVGAVGGGQIIGVVQDEDPDTGTPRDYMAATDFVFSTTSGFVPGTGQFVIKLRGRNALGADGPIRQAYVRVFGGLEAAFTDPNDGIPPPSDQDFFAYESQFSAGQAAQGFDPLLNSNGCPITFGSKRTNDLGEAAFEIDKDKLRSLMLRQQLVELGEIRVIDGGAPIPGVDVFDQAGNPGNGRKGGSGDEVYLTMEVFAGPQGFGETGVRDVDGNPDFPPFDQQPGIVPTYVVLAIDMQTGAVRLDGSVGQFGSTNGSMTSPGVVTVNMERINAATTADVVPYLLRIGGMAPPTGNATKFFRGMNAFPSTSLWPDALFQPNMRNVGRQMRFTWDVGFGTANAPKLLLATNCPSNPVNPNCQPQLQEVATFALDSTSSCNLEGEIDYLAALPDLTRWQIPAKTGQPSEVCYRGRIVIERGLHDAMQDFKICTRRPPEEMNALNTQVNQATFRIDARNTRYTGELALPQSDVTGDDPRMQEYELPPQQNASNNDGAFNTSVDGAGAAVEAFDVTTEHVIGNNGTEATGVDNPTLFGFSGNQQLRSQIERTTVLDTGNIPLFRYPWGFSPIAGAVLGADFWLGADVGFYGTLGNPTGTGTLMDATIDPRMEGGVDMFFDLDILFGLVSASVSALPSLDLTLREVMGRGGMFPVQNDNAGICYGFDLDAEMEICAVFCASDRFNLFRVEDGSGCPALNATKAADEKAYGRGGFDLVRPMPRPSAVAADGFNHQLVVRVDSRNALLAEHMLGTEIETTRTIKAATTGVQHIDVAYLGSNRALAVWSESALSTAQLQALMTARLGYNPVRESSDELARQQQLRWSYFNGTAWSAPQAIGQSGSVGKPRVAGCKTTFVLLHACNPRTPRAYVAWEYDRAGDLSRPSLEVWGAEFTPAGGFAPRTRLSTASAGNDLHPAVAWLSDTPVVAWISTTGSAYGEPRTRQLAYRIVDRAGTFTARTVAGSSGAGWPSLATRGDDEVILAFTRAQDESLVGNRNALTLAKGTRCDTGACTFQVTQPRDPAGRQFRGERPSLAIESDGTAAVQFRGLAFGPAPNGTVGLPGDAPGMLMGTGDVIGLRVGDFSAATVTVAPQNLSADGLMHMRPDFVFDAALDAFVGISQEAVQPQQKFRALEFAKRFAPDGFKPLAQAKAIGDDGLTMRSMSNMPDLRIESFAVAAPYLAPGASSSYTVTIRNAGGSYDPSVHGNALLLTAWDAPPGAGIAASSPFALSVPLAPNAKLTLTRTVTAPGGTGHFIDQRRTAFVEVRPDAAMEDGNGDDNLAQATIGELPAPVGLTARIKTGLGTLGLDWDTSADPRVVGYRVYKRAENGDFVPYGSSRASGYIDVFAGFRNVEQYRLTAYSARGIESPMSAVLIAAPEQMEGLFDDGFESPR